MESLEVVFQENKKLGNVPLHNLGLVVSDHVHKQCTAIGKGLRVATVGEEASFEVIFEENCSPSTAIMSCQLKPEDPQFAYRFERKLDSKGTIVCSYIPTCPGPRTLSVCVGGQDIPNSPFSLTVLPLAKEPTNIFEGLNCPSGIAVISEKSQLVVAEKGSDCITLVNIHQPMTQRKSFRLPRPRGIAISSDKQILAISQSTNSLVKVNMEEEKVVKVVGGRVHLFSRARPLYFNKPTGIAVSPDGTIFVTEYSSHHVQVLHLDLTYSMHLG